MKKISFKTVADILSEKEMRNVLGGSIQCLCVCDFDGYHYQFFVSCTGSHSDCMGWFCSGAGCGTPHDCSY